MTPLTLPCPTCNGDGFLSTGDRHADTRTDVCPRCRGRMVIPAATGETPEASARPKAIDPGRTAYEARYAQTTLGPRGLGGPAWDDLPAEGRAVWARVEAACAHPTPPDTAPADRATGDVEGLRALSEKATQGVWAIDHTGPEEAGYAFLKCTGAKRGGSDRFVSWHQMARFVVEVDGKPSETGQANADLAIAVVNAYRSGELAHRIHVLAPPASAADGEYKALLKRFRETPEDAKPTPPPVPPTRVAGLDREAVARIIYEANPFYTVGPEAVISWDDALARDAKHASVPDLTMLTASAYLLADKILALAPTPGKAPGQDAVEALRRTAEGYSQRVCEWDDRTSPEDYPNHLLITARELEDLLVEFVGEPATLASLRSTPPDTGGVRSDA